MTLLFDKSGDRKNDNFAGRVFGEDRFRRQGRVKRNHADISRIYAPHAGENQTIVLRNGYDSANVLENPPEESGIRIPIELVCMDCHTGWSSREFRAEIANEKFVVAEVAVN